MSDTAAVITVWGICTCLYIALWSTLILLQLMDINKTLIRIELAHNYIHERSEH